MTLRDEAITHMAQALDDWPTIETPGYSGLDVGAVLDALLDFLDAHTEEWKKAPTLKARREAYMTASGLVAALRGTTEEP